MSLTQREKEMVIERLDLLDEIAKRLILASIEALAEWLSHELYFIFLKIRDGLGQLWNWMKSIFS